MKINVQRFACLAVLLGLWSCSESESTTGDDANQKMTSEFEPPADWASFATKCSFSFRAPPGTVEESVQGIDSCVTHYTVGECNLSGDYGGYSDSLTGNVNQPEYTNEPIRIDGRDATLVRFRTDTDGNGDGSFAAGVHFTRVTSDSDFAVKFTFYASCDSAAGQATMLDLFKTVDFDD